MTVKKVLIDMATQKSPSAIVPENDCIEMENLYKKVVDVIVSHLLEKVKSKSSRYVISVAGESGCGKSETTKAISDEFLKQGLKTAILGQDHYCYLPPKFNDQKRKEDAEWLGPHLEIDMNRLEKNLKDAVRGENEIIIPRIDSVLNKIEEDKINLEGVNIVIAEGTYVSLLKNIDTKIFIDRNRLDTLQDRKKRNRRNEVNDPFTEQILITEHKIIAGHKFLADIIITNNYEVIIPE